MKGFSNIKIRVKLMLGFGIVAFIAGIVGVIGITKIKEIDSIYSDLYKNYGVAISDIADVSISYQRIRTNLDNIILYSNSDKANKEISEIKNYDVKIQEGILKFEKSIQTEAGRTELSNLKMLVDKYDVIKDKVIELVLSGKESEALILINSNETQSISDQIDNSVDSLFELKTLGGLDKSQEYSSEAEHAVITVIIVIVIAMIIAIVLGIIMSKIISKPLSELMNVTNEISRGNLDLEIFNDSNDEIGVLSKSMNKMRYKLNQVFEHISFAADQVTVGSRQVSDSTIALSQGATEQASAVEELTASIEQISAQIKVNAENAKNANAIANSARTNAVKRNSEMELMLNAMDEINDSSNNISKIIKVIDEIAFQTNILALNAAVEAARAGQYGKGFTVVADEVRNLAARSARAAKETTEIIEQSIIKIQDGTSIANQTAEALESIVRDIEHVSGIINNIAEASDEQAIGISQISHGVIQISQVVQVNSATAEESAAASEELAGQAEVLKEQVQMFSLKSESHNAKLSYDVESSCENYGRYIEESVENKYKKSPKNESKVKRIILSDSEFGKY